MGKPLFQSRGHRYIMSPAEREAINRHAKVISVLRHICEQKQQTHIEPPRATWLELQQKLDKREMEYLDFLVREGVVSRWDSIRFYTYAIDFPALARYEQAQRKSAQM